MKVKPTAYRAYQNAVMTDPRFLYVAPFLATVETIHTDRMTCDVVTLNGFPLHNVPVLSKVGLQDGEVYGELDLPSVGDTVLVFQAGPSGEEQIIVGSFAPFLFSKFAGDQVAASSSSKQFTTKLLEDGVGKGYRRIFKSGTTLEVDEDGTLVIETPSGTYVRIDESDGGKIEIRSTGDIEIGNTGHAASAREGDETVSDVATDSSFWTMWSAFFGVISGTSIPEPGSGSPSAFQAALAAAILAAGGAPSSLTGKINEGSDQVSVGDS